MLGHPSALLDVDRRRPGAAKGAGLPADETAALESEVSPPDRRGRRWERPLAALGIVLVLALLGWFGWNAWSSRLPAAYSVMDFGAPDYGGGSTVGHGAHQRAPGARSVASLTGPRTGTPDYRITLTAAKATVRLRSGRSVGVWAFNGSVPGPEIRVRQGDLVEVTLVNEDIEDGVTIHWHGVDVPNAEDGVAGVTQDATLPGGRHTYRFRVEQVGTFWYHSHQVSSEQVKRGLFGAFVILPRERARSAGLDQTVLSHTYSSIVAIGREDRVTRRAVAPGTPVRLRLVNTDNAARRFSLEGTPFRVVAIDGTDLDAPSALRGRTLEIAAGGRYDVAFTMPATPTKLAILGTPVGIAFSRDGKREPVAEAVGPEFDPTDYGRPGTTPFGAASRFDRSFRMVIDERFGFRDGRFGRHWTVNGKIYPHMPTYVVERGDLVKFTIVNRTRVDHPMHLHGHHMLVLSRNGRRARGSPWWVDTLNVEPGETYETALRADNPGLWMDHCHNLTHAAQGLVLHLAYAGVTTPYVIGGDRKNEPE